MSPEQAIHEVWSDNADLVAVIPAARFVTGWQEPPSEAGTGEFVPELIPYAALEYAGEEDVETSSDSRFATILFRVHAWCEGLTDLRTARNLMEAMLDPLDRNWNDGGILSMTQGDVSQTRLSTGVWHLMMEYATRTWRQRTK